MKIQNKKRPTNNTLDEWVNVNWSLLEKIDYDLWIQGDAEVDRYRGLIDCTIALLPEDIRDRVLDEVLFIVTSKHVYGTIFDLAIKEPRTLHCILLNFASMNRLSRTGVMDTIAHEIAHYWLDHGFIGSNTAEHDADELIKRWGFRKCYIKGTPWERVHPS